MESLLALVKKKPPIFFLIHIVVLLVFGLLKWRLNPPIDCIWFFIGGGIGIIFLDIAELFFNVHPSPFRSVIFAAGFFVVGLFVYSSSGSLLASGLVTSIYITQLLWLYGEWHIVGNINTWFKLIDRSVSLPLQKVCIAANAIGFIILAFMFLHG